MRHPAIRCGYITNAGQHLAGGGDDGPCALVAIFMRHHQTRMEV